MHRPGGLHHFQAQISKTLQQDLSVKCIFLTYTRSPTRPTARTYQAGFQVGPNMSQHVDKLVYPRFRSYALNSKSGCCSKCPRDLFWTMLMHQMQSHSSAGAEPYKQSLLQPLDFNLLGLASHL